jgi:hypothetical protein
MLGCQKLDQHSQKSVLCVMSLLGHAFDTSLSSLQLCHENIALKGIMNNEACESGR